MTCCTPERPPPPYSFGQAGTIQPRSESFFSQPPSACQYSARLKRPVPPPNIAPPPRRASSGGSSRWTNSRTSWRKAASSGLSLKSTFALPSDGRCRRHPRQAEGVGTFPPLKLWAAAQGRSHVIIQAQRLHPAGDPREDAALICFREAGPHRVLVGEAAAHLHLPRVGADLGHAVVEQVRAEQPDEELLGSEVVVDGSHGWQLERADDASGFRLADLVSGHLVEAVCDFHPIRPGDRHEPPRVV